MFRFFQELGFQGEDLETIRRLMKEAVSADLNLLAICDEYGRISSYEERLLLVRALYAERLDENLLPAYEDRERRRTVAMRFFAEGELEPLCDFMEQRFLKVFDNRDLRWSNELTVKTAFLTILFNDTFYIVDSETAIDRGYADLTLILRPDTRKYKLLDHLLEFKFLRWEDLGADNQAARGMDRAALRALAPVADRIREAEAQLADYRKTLERVYGEKLKLRTHAVVCVGMERLVW